MNGPEHYEQAQCLLNQAENLNPANPQAAAEIALLTSRAQAHATLALAAATALPAGGAGTESRMAWVRSVHGLGNDYDVKDSFL